MNRRMQDFMVLVVAALLHAACATGSPGVVYVETAPPPMVYEVVTVAPGPGYVWVAGYWHWTGVRYSWVSGRWRYPPSGYTVWVPARYERQQDRWKYRPGHWGGDRGRGRGRGNGRRG